jgi:hypothetical protein
LRSEPYGTIGHISNRRQCPTTIQIAERPWPLAISGLQLANDQAGVADQMIDGPVEMATCGDAAMNRMQPALPTAYGFRRCLPVLQKMQHTGWFEYSMNLQ